MNPIEEIKKHAVLSGFGLLVLLWLLVRGRKTVATVALPSGDATVNIPSVDLTYNVPPALNFNFQTTYPMLGDLSYNPSLTFGQLAGSGASQSCGCGGGTSNGFASIGDLISNFSNEALDAYQANLQSLLGQYGG
jgi:hypothetical protein